MSGFGRFPPLPANKKHLFFAQLPVKTSLSHILPLNVYV
jgi:hypothetical protein